MSDFETQYKLPNARLFDYFIVCGLEETEFYSNGENNTKTFTPHSSNIPFKTVPLYVYNANKITINEQLNEKQQFEEAEILLQVTRYCYCDLSDLINKCMHHHNNNDNTDGIIKFERFSFVFRESGGNDIYNHCVRIFYDKKLLPTSLCLVSSYNFNKLFIEILNNILMSWIYGDYNKVFTFLTDILLYNQGIPPSLGDTFRINSITLTLESPNRQNLQILFNTLSIDNILFIISCILTEQKLIFISTNLQILSECIYALISLIYPFKWQYLFIPILCEKYLNFFTTQLPFIIGIKRYLTKYLQAINELKNVIIIDLDKQIIIKKQNKRFKFKSLPNKPCWKLKRELIRITKQYEYYLFMNNINKFKNCVINSHKSIIQNNNYDISHGWNDTPFYNAFLSFFIVFIGDWKKFYDETNPLSPKTPFYLKNSKKNKKKLQTNGLKQIFYTQQALEYLEVLLKTQLFKSWFIRQRKKNTVNAHNNMYDFALKNNSKYTGYSYSGCYQYLSTIFNSLDKKLIKYVIDNIFEYTQNTNHLHDENMLDLIINSSEFNAIINIINYRIFNILNDNNINNYYGCYMAFHLLLELMQKSSEKFVIYGMHYFYYYAHILNKYYFNPNNIIQKQIKYITNKFIQFIVNIKQRTIGCNNVYVYKWDGNKHKKYENMIVKSYYFNKLSSINFNSNDDKDMDILLIINEMLSPPKNIFHYHKFTKMSQFRKDNARKYRKRASKQEVRIIPPFLHLHAQFKPNTCQHFEQKEKDASVYIKHTIENNTNNMDIATKIGNYFDKKFKDENTVVIVANTDKAPKLSYRNKADYQEKYINLNGKYIFIYHIQTVNNYNNEELDKAEFDKFVHELSIMYNKPHEIADRLDIKFGNGFNVVGGNHNEFYVYCRFSNEYNTRILLPNGNCVVVWRI